MNKIKITTIDKNFNIKSFESITEAAHHHGINRGIVAHNYDASNPYAFHDDIAFCKTDRLQDFTREILNQVKLKAQADLNGKYIEALNKINKL